MSRTKNMDNIENRLHALKTQRQEADRRRTIATSKLDEIEARREQTLQALRDEGFNTPEEAVAEVKRLNASVEAVLEEISQKVSGL